MEVSPSAGCSGHIDFDSSQCRTDRSGVREAGGNVDAGAERQRHNRPNSGDRHQASTNAVIANDLEQLAVEFREHLAKLLPGGQQRLHDLEKFGHTLDKLPYAFVELRHPDDAAPKSGARMRRVR